MTNSKHCFSEYDVAYDFPEIKTNKDNVRAWVEEW